MLRDAEGDVPVAPVVVERLDVEGEVAQRDVGRVHRLEGEAAGSAIDVDVLDKLLHRLNDLLQKIRLDKSRFKHFCGSNDKTLREKKFKLLVKRKSLLLIILLL